MKHLDIYTRFNKSYLYIFCNLFPYIVGLLFYEISPYFKDVVIEKISIDKYPINIQYYAHFIFDMIGYDVNTIMMRILFIYGLYLIYKVFFRYDHIHLHKERGYVVCDLFYRYTKRFFNVLKNNYRHLFFHGNTIDNTIINNTHNHIIFKPIEYNEKQAFLFYLVKLIFIPFTMHALFGNINNIAISQFFSCRFNLFIHNFSGIFIICLPNN